MDQLPSLPEVEAAIEGLKNDKVAGSNGFSLDVFKHSGSNLRDLLLGVFPEHWRRGEVSPELKLAIMIAMYKTIGHRSDCNNHRRQQIMDMAGKVFARILLVRFSRYIASKALSESQCGFRADCSTTGITFVCQQLLEKSREMRTPINTAFIGLQNAFGTTNRDLLLGVFEKCGWPSITVPLLGALHTDTRGAVASGSETSEPYAVTGGVKQGCVFAPAFSNVYHAAVSMLITRAGTCACVGGIPLRYSFDQQARTKVSHDKVRDLPHLGDAAIACSTSEELQKELKAQSEANTRFGLRMNVKKTEMMHSKDDGAMPPIFLGEEFKTTGDFSYLGCIISSSCSTDKEFTNRIGNLSFAHGQLREREYLK